MANKYLVPQNEIELLRILTLDHNLLSLVASLIITLLRLHNERLKTRNMKISP